MSIISRLSKFLFPTLLVNPPVVDDPLIPSISDLEPKKESFTPMPTFENAGKFESMTDKFSEVFELDNQTWTGVQINTQNYLSGEFVTAHTLLLGKRENIDPVTNKGDDEKSQYAFTNYLRLNNFSFNGRWSVGNETSTRAIVSYDRKPFSCQFSGNFSEDERKTQWEVEVGLTGRDMCAQMKVQFPAFLFSYTQPLTRNNSIGTELLFSPLNGASRVKWLLKNEDKLNGHCSTVGYSQGIGPTETSLTYSHRLIKNFDLLAGLDISHTEKQWATSYKVGYNLKHDTMFHSYRAYVDSSWKVACIAEQPLENFVVQFSAKVDVLKNCYDFGIGLVT